jgi:Rha family phage regulatory protein
MMNNSLLRTTESEHQTITTLEIAEMMNVAHWQVLRKLDGREAKGKHIRGYVDILADNQMVVSDFFVPATYLSEQNKEMPCYKVTKMGCEFLANKFTGEKGVLFTAKYIKRFHEMEDMLKAGTKPVLEDFESKAYTPKVPMVSDWYERNKGRMERMCNKAGNTRKYLYHCILLRVSEKYDLEQAREIYKAEVGYYPVYAIDIIGYFAELAKEADRYLDRIEKSMYG